MSLALHAFVGQFADHTANVFDDAGLDAFGGFIQDQQARLGGQCPRNGQLLLLPA